MSTSAEPRAAGQAHTRSIGTAQAGQGSRTPDTRDQAWRIGAAGEIKVGSRLNRLRRHGWHVLHSIPLGLGGDIDHLLIGPAGVFTANTKHHPNARVTVGRSLVFARGYQVTHIGQALREAGRAKNALSSALGRAVTMEPLVIIHGARVSG